MRPVKCGWIARASENFPKRSGPLESKVSSQIKLTMDNLLYSRWLNELAQQCRFARLAHSELRASLLAFEPDRTFLFAHALLAHASEAAELLWPEREDLKTVGEALSAKLELGESSVLRKVVGREKHSRSDVSFKEWLANLGSDGFVETNIMPRGSLGGYKSDTFQRDLDPETLMFHFRGTPCDLDALTDELVRIEKAVIREQAKIKQW
jgi:hypothetical protein